MKVQFNLIAVLFSILAVSACHEKENLVISQPVIQAGASITTDTLSGSVKGTMRAGKTYYFKSDITVNDGDTLLMQNGVKLIAIADGKTWQTSPQITVNGTFISLGTKESPNYITVKNAAEIHTEAAAQNYTNVYKGWWGGIVCSPAAATAANPSPKGGDLILKWTHLEFAGGPAGPNNDPSVWAQGDARYIIFFGNISKNFIMEDSWIFGSKDDAIRTIGGKLSIMRNTFEMCGQAGGEAFNMKSGTVGDLAYNLIIGAATNGLKASNSGNTTVQCNVAMYNNTILNSGFRQTKTGRGLSINYEAGARGMVYNNMIVNCRFGLRLVSDADLPNIKYNNQFYYGSTQALVNEFNATQGVAVTQSGDVRESAPKQNSPLFFGYDVENNNLATAAAPISAALQPAYFVTAGAANFRLQPTSPAIGKGKTDFQPIRAVTATGIFGADITPPGADIGAYQLNGSGNQH